MKTSFMPSTSVSRPVRRFLPPTPATGNGNSSPAVIAPKTDGVTLSQLPPPPAPSTPTEPVATSPAPAQAPQNPTAPLTILEEPSLPAPTGPRYDSPMEKMLRDLDDGWRVSAFQNEHEDAGWKVRGDKHDTRFFVNRLEGSEVAFISRDEEGNQVQKRGVIAQRPESQSMSSMFKLEGQEGEFNTNYLEALAVKPEEPAPYAAAGKTFRTRFEEAGWQVREPRDPGGFNTDWDFTPDKLKGRDVAFITLDESGQRVERRGVLKATEQWNSTLFSLEGQEGSFNANYVLDMAARRPQPKSAQ